MVRLLWLALVLGYVAGIGAALFFLPGAVIEPHYGTVALVGAMLAAGLGALALLARSGSRFGGRGGSLFRERRTTGAALDNAEGDVAPPPASAAAPGAAESDATAPGAPASAGLSLLQPLELRQALQEGRVDLFVQPLACLPPQLFAPYRALARLRGRDGHQLEPAAYLPTASRCDLLGLIDQIFILRAVHAIRQAAAEGHEVRLFCGLTSSSLGDPDVLAEIADFLADHAELAERLVIEVDRVRLNRPGDQALARLRRLGLRLCLRRFMPAGLDARLLARRGISFVRLEQPPDAARQNRAGLEAELGPLRRSLNDAGITLVLDQTEAKPVLVELSDHPMGVAQGRTFGGGARSSAA